MNISEASAVNVLWSHYVGGKSTAEQDVERAWTLLARASHKALMAGVADSDVKPGLQQARRGRLLRG